MPREPVKLQPGEQVLVEVFSRRYGAKALAVDDEKIVVTSPEPAHDVRVGEVVRVFFSRPDGMYYYEGEFIRQYDDPPRWLIGISTGVHRIRRRDYVRVPDGSAWIVRCAFRGIREAERQRVIRYVFRLEVARARS